MIIVGIFVNKTNILNQNINSKLSGFILNITLPLFIITSFDFEYSQSILKNMLIILVFGFIFHGLCFLIGLIIYRRYPKSIKNILIFALIFTNCGYIGFPILDKIYGKIGIMYGSLFLIPFNVFLWTLGVFLFRNQNSSDNKKLKQIIFNPGIIASIIGVLLFAFSIKLPYFIKISFSSIGQITTPLSMIMIGGTISTMKLKEIFVTKYIYFNSLLRLIIIPIIVYFILKLFNFDNIIIGICIILAAMPAAVTTPIFAEKYNGDIKFASKIVFISTILAILSIPFIIYFFVSI